SLFTPKGQAVRAINGAREAAEAYLNLPDDAPDAERIRLNAKLEKHRRKLPGIKQKHRDELIESETRYRDLLERARGEHEASSAS
ncbi:TerC family protein, partial [Amycolatopsis sp. H6(2020)]|nr:TerC family protein [Amycolatopsis sp. H6(2020)]